MFDSSVFWPAFQNEGLLTYATVKQSKGVAVDVWVGFNQPDRLRFDGHGRSRDYEIEFQSADLPDLGEGNRVTLWNDETKVSGTRYIVREDPFVSDAGGDDGYFRRALLTKV